jgi:hypothetical protein
MLLMRNMDNSILSLPEFDSVNLLETIAREFRQGFEDLAEQADRELYGKNFIFSRYGKELYPYFEETGATTVPGCIIPIKEGRPVASVDSTCVLVGESSDGALYAARTAVGFSCGGSLRRFIRFGPILVYASSSGLTGLGSKLSSPELALILSDSAVAERVIRNTIERRIVESLLGSEEKLIVMADGSLKHPFGQFPGGVLPGWRRGNSLVGFAKSSNLILSEGTVSSLSKADRPVYQMVDSGMVKTALAKFSPDGLVFRLDLVGDEDPAPAILGRILWNDAFAAGYPESLKVAHHLSVFSRADDQALKAFVTRRFRIRRLPTFALRTIALGSFKGGA